MDKRVWAGGNGVPLPLTLPLPLSSAVCASENKGMPHTWFTRTKGTALPAIKASLKVLLPVGKGLREGNWVE